MATIMILKEKHHMLIVRKTKKKKIAANVSILRRKSISVSELQRKRKMAALSNIYPTEGLRGPSARGARYMWGLNNVVFLAPLAVLL